MSNTGDRMSFGQAARRRGCRCLFLVLLTMPIVASAATAPTGLLCELMAHPEETVITDRTPEFGWIYNPSFAGDMQSGYHIIVSSTQANADVGTGDVWDSDLIGTNASINVSYAGPGLHVSSNYFWAVQTRDSNGQMSPFSASQAFFTATQFSETPVVKPTTNGLVWIWHPAGASDNSTNYFRKAVNLPASTGVADGQFLITADNRFDLYVNGTWVGGTAGGSQDWKTFRLFTLGTLLHSGVNTLAVEGWNDNGAAGLTGKLQYLGTDGSTNTLPIDGTWATSQTASPGWEQPGFDDSSWLNAQELGNYGVAPWYSTATLPGTGVIYNASTNAWANRYPLRFEDVVPLLVTNTAPDRWFIDFGKDGFAYATLHLNGSFSGQTIEVRFGEAADGMAVDTTPAGTVRFETANFGLQDGDVDYELRPPANGGQTINIVPVAGVVLPFRYLELINCPGAVTSDTVKQHRLQYEFDDEAATFDSSSPALNQVWGLCKYSMKATSFAGVFVDGDRERKPYEADAYINQLGYYAVDREFTLARYSHEYLLEHPTWPFEWKFHSILIAWADYMQTGNTEAISAHYDTLKSKLFLDRARGDGLILGFPNNSQNVNDDIVDWPAGERDGFVITGNYYNAVNNAFYYRCLRVMTQMAAAIGETNDAADFATRADQVYVSYNNVLWDGTMNRYRDGDGIAHYAAHASFFPLAFGLVPAANQPAVLSFLHGKGMPCSVYGAQYLLEGLYEAGDADHAFGLMTTNGQRGWLNMLNIGSTITTEAWDFTFKPNMDWNHAWGAAAGNIISRYVLGLRPLAPGFGHILIQPHLGTMLSYTAGTIPTIRGPVSITVSNSPAGFQVVVNLPGNVTADVMLPVSGLVNPVAIIDGRPVSGTVSNDWLTVSNVGSGEHSLVAMEGRPTITFVASPGTLQLSWPSNYLGWFLQTRTNVLNEGFSGSWVTVSDSQFYTTTNIPVSPTTTTVFYRLLRPAPQPTIQSNRE